MHNKTNGQRGLSTFLAISSLLLLMGRTATCSCEDSGDDAHTDCRTAPCQNGALCSNVGAEGTYYCHCYWPHYGRRCQYTWEPRTTSTTTSTSTTTTTPAPPTTPVNACNSSPCLNGGRCHGRDGTTYFFCFCSFPYCGKRCHVEKKTDVCDVTASIGLATPTYRSHGGQDTYSCQECPASSCASEVHFVIQYEPDNIRTYNRTTRRNDYQYLEIEVTVESTNNNHLPVSLVLSTFRGARWVVKIPNHINVPHIFLTSNFVSQSSVRVVDLNGVDAGNFQLHTPEQDHYMVDYKGFGEQDPVYRYNSGCRGSFQGLHDVIDGMNITQFGCFRSFSGRYRAHTWTLNLDANPCAP